VLSIVAIMRDALASTSARTEAKNTR
jgi:hypothetical protein